MKLKKLATVAMTAILGTSLLVGCSGQSGDASDDKITVAMITDVAGVNDQSFNQSAWEGLQRAQEELANIIINGGKNTMLKNERTDQKTAKKEKNIDKNEKYKQYKHYGR